MQPRAPLLTRFPTLQGYLSVWYVEPFYLASQVSIVPLCRPNACRWRRADGRTGRGSKRRVGHQCPAQ